VPRVTRMHFYGADAVSDKLSKIKLETLDFMTQTGIPVTGRFAKERKIALVRNSVTYRQRSMLV